LGHDENQTIRALREAESFDGPSIVIAYSHCIAHGIDMVRGYDQQDRAVRSGYWPLFRFDPRRVTDGLPPLQLDSKRPSIPLLEYTDAEERFAVLRRTHPEIASELHATAQEEVRKRWNDLEALASRPAPSTVPKATPQASKLPPGYS
jgi:pyruvate-ferredoxin/flavodoxin oxidoreductase